MLTFLRKIRQRLIAEHRLRDYLLYAVGEIVLVVVGILIALQINLWNEERKARTVEKAYYCRILEDLELEREMILQSHEDVGVQIRNGKQLILDMHRSAKSRKELLNDFLGVIRLAKFVPPQAAFTDLLSSGNLQLLKDIELKNSLTEYYGKQENIIIQMDLNREAMVGRSLNYHTTRIGLQDMDYVSEVLGKEILDLLPESEWTGNPDHPQFREFEGDMVFFVAMLLRHQVHLDDISKEMKEPYEKLQSKCSSSG